MTLIVRQARPADLNAVVRLVRDYWAFEALSGFSAQRIAQQLGQLIEDDRTATLWVATEDELPVGYLLMVYVFSLEHGGSTAEVDELFVAPQCRNSGAGARMLHAAEVHAANSGCTNVSLQVGTGNLGALRFYERLGYRPRSGFRILDKALDPPQ